jgi:DNA-binding MarR family transcriptional regulator
VVDDPWSARPELVDGLVQLSFAVQSVLADAAGAYDLSVPQLRLLGVLRDRTPGMLELATLFGVDKSSMTGLVDRAEQRGLVLRQSAEHDRRSVLVSITPAGRTLAAKVEAVVYREISSLVAPLSARDRTGLETLLTRWWHRGRHPTRPDPAGLDGRGG